MKKFVSTRMGLGGAGAEDPAEITMRAPSARFMRDWEKTEHPVELALVYVRYLAEVDTKAQTFKIAMGLDMVWPAADADAELWARNPEKFKPQYVPNFEFPNAKEEAKELRAQENGNPYKIIERDGRPYNFLRTLCYLTVLQRFDLHHFPFDVQELTVVMDTSFASVERSLFVPAHTGNFQDGQPQPGGALLALNRQFCAIPEFRARRAVIEFASRSADGEAELDEDAFRWSQVVLRFQLERRAEGFIVRIAFLTFLLALTSVCAFALDPVEERADRMNYLIVLVLATVAFLLVAQEQLPPLPYLSFIEQYVLSVFTSVVLLLFIVALLGAEFVTLSPEQLKQTDRNFALGFVIWMGVSQLAFLSWGVHKRNMQRRKLSMGAMQLHDKNFDRAMDAPVMIKGEGMLGESQRTAREMLKANAFMSFAGQEQ